MRVRVCARTRTPAGQMPPHRLANFTGGGRSRLFLARHRNAVNCCCCFVVYPAEDGWVAYREEEEWVSGTIKGGVTHLARIRSGRCRLA